MLKIDNDVIKNRKLSEKMKVKGIAYYPEHWEQSNWDKDLKRIKEMGVNTIRIGEFMWSLLEPREGEFDFTLLDQMIEKISSYGFDILLGTPTATFPVWTLKNYSNIMAVDEMGRQRKYGTRRQYCYNSKDYLRLSRIITGKMVERYADVKNIIGIQIDNEIGHEGSDFCQCDNCRRGFSDFLERKYDSVDHMNQVYGNVFWGQNFIEFSDVEVPFGDLLGHNPSLRLDYARFLSESTVAYCDEMLQVVHKFKGDHQEVTTNLPGGLFNKWFDANKLVENIDFVSFDNYPIWGGEINNADDAKVAMELDMIRGLKEKKFWIVEELIGAQGHDYVGWLPRPGQAKLWAMQAHLRGAENIFFFRYKGLNKGEEQFCQGVYDVDDELNDKFYEVKDFFEDVSKDFNTEDLASNNKVALLYDFDNIWSWKIQPQSSEYNFLKEFMKYYRPLYELGLGVDVISTDKDFSHYDMVILPNMQIVSDDLYQRLEAFTNENKTLIFGYRSGIRNKQNNMRLGKNILQDMIGATIEQYEAMGESSDLAVDYKSIKYPLSVWRDILRLNTAEKLVGYNDYGFENKSCVTKNNYNKSAVYYMGASLDCDLMKELYKDILKDSQIAFYETSNERIQLNDKTFELNHSFEEVSGLKPVSYKKQA
ncbi:beta-galactosidase [Acidaminobacter sp. JC074]|uniref:beta-galactosidase n=1 Tax=Acidaminobacter sp. JC074 TaxID=2530199 RepID=UPI001F0CEABA|nr:beta-galactosidase [Acidaminobacter sp. JC074]MCH4886530.1 beta-galactosidase [Acidaminobacter sp. JC074]